LGFGDLKMGGVTKTDFKRGGTHHRAASGSFIKTISYDKLLGFGRQSGDEFIVNSILNIESRPSRAILASVIKDTQSSPVRS
jgi:hypothetical protein